MVDVSCRLRLEGRRLLVVEDEYLVATALVRSLRALGAEIVGPAPTVSGAMDLLDREGQRLDGAILDVNLRGEKVYPVADRLLSAGTAFAFVTGYDAAAIPPGYATLPRCEKPIRQPQLLQLLIRLLQTPAPQEAVCAGQPARGRP